MTLHTIEYPEPEQIEIDATEHHPFPKLQAVDPRFIDHAKIHAMPHQLDMLDDEA